ncbi:hypothetical protein Tco_1296993 [Tanacetum coccineum]
MDKSDAWRSVAQDLELLAAKEAVKAMRNLQAIIQCKAQICFGKSTKDNHWSDQREDVRVQNKEARRILIELEVMAQRLESSSKRLEDTIIVPHIIYAFDMRDSNGIEMLIGANFLRSMKGGIRIEGDEITIYKKVTKIKTSNQTEIAEIAELEVSEEEFLEINKSIYFNQEGSRAFQEQFKPVIDRLKQQGYIGEEPLKHWKKNGEDIINPDITIEDRPLKHVTPAMEDLFRKHVDSLLKIGA